jgi:hypothetical protein
VTPSPAGDAASVVVVRTPQDTADLIAAAVLACPFVVTLSGGRAGEVATYLPGRQVAGVRTTDDGVEVHVVGVYGPTCDSIAEQVRAAVRTAVGPMAVTVGVDDLDLTATVLPA